MDRVFARDLATLANPSPPCLFHEKQTNTGGGDEDFGPHPHLGIVKDDLVGLCLFCPFVLCNVHWKF
jgi:hypothetical protein